MERVYLLLRSPKGSVGILELDEENMPVVSASTNQWFIFAMARAKLEEIPLQEFGEWEWHIFIYDNTSGDFVGRVLVNKTTIPEILIGVG